MFRIQFVVRGPEVTGGGDLKSKLVKVDFLSSLEGCRQTVPYPGILAPSPIGSNSLGMVETVAFFLTRWKRPADKYGFGLDVLPQYGGLRAMTVEKISLARKCSRRPWSTSQSEGTGAYYWQCQSQPVCTASFPAVRLTACRSAVL